MLLIFDLDDTLYEELTFVKSGFIAVANYLAKKYNLNKKDIFSKCLYLLNTIGRGKIFDVVLKEYNIFSKNELKKCIYLYRYHKPKIKLYEDAKFFLKKFNKEQLLIVTDGNKLVQRNKFKALKLYNYVKKAYFTRQYGIKYEKPSPYVFLKISNIEKIEPNKIIYFGDNPYKDFFGIKPLGFKTIRIKRGVFSNVCLSNEFEAHLTFNNFNEINKIVLFNLINQS